MYTKVDVSKKEEDTPSKEGALTPRELREDGSRVLYSIN
jgi:hypothetical protein